jgi:biotin carboxyl carrier protein
MNLRISVEDRVYEVEVEMADNAGGAKRQFRPTGVVIPDRVLRPRPPQRLPEDCVVRSPMAGRVTAILAAPAEKIRRHQGVVLIEAMKMEIAIGPAADGTLHTICVAAGDAVATGQVLFEMAR